MNVHFCFVFFIAIISILCDFITYIFNLEYICAITFSIVIVSLGFGIFILKHRNVHFDFEKNDIFLFLILFVYMISTKLFCFDNVYDVSTYHIYLQENPFADKVNFDFFPGRIFCIFLFPLGDRMHYIFRYFLGYRLGTIFSYYIIIVLFYQIKKILKSLNKVKSTSIYSYIILFIFMYVGFLGCYYIDNLAIAFLVEIYYIILSEENLIKNYKKIYFIAIFSGIAIGIKITSIFFIIIFAIYALIKNREYLKDLKLHIVLIFFILAIMPYIVYMIDNYKQTGSILFPYYNSIFKSEYYELSNWIEPRFGINSLLQKFFWPIIVSLQYKCYGDESYYIDPIWAIGYIILIIYFINKLINKTKKDELFIESVIAIVSTRVWIKFLYGYTRYGVLVVILYCILMASLLIRCIEKNERKIKKIKLKISNELEFLFHIKLDKYIYIIILIVIILAGIKLVIENFDFQNVKYILKDRKDSKYNITIDGVWGSVLDNCSYEVLIRDNVTPIYNLEKEYYIGSEKSLQMYYERITENNIYMIIEVNNKNKSNNKTIKCLKENNFEIQEIVKEYNSSDIPYIDAHSIWYLVKLKYVNEE